MCTEHIVDIVCLLDTHEFATDVKSMSCVARHYFILKANLTQKLYKSTK